MSKGFTLHEVVAGHVVEDMVLTVSDSGQLSSLPWTLVQGSSLLVLSACSVWAQRAAAVVPAPARGELLRSLPWAAANHPMSSVVATPALVRGPLMLQQHER